jgi:putative MFS transporter
MLELLERQKKLTANQWKIAGAATLGDMLDFFDFFLIGFVLAFVVKEWHLTYGQSGAILLAPGECAIRLAAVRLDGRQGRSAAGLITAVLNVARHRRDGTDTRRGVDLPGRLPVFRRVRCDRVVFG